MELNTRRCMQCKGEMTMTVLDPIAGEDQGVGMRIERMPAMRCPEGHKRFVAPEFAVRMMEAFVAGGPLAPLAAAADRADRTAASSWLRPRQLRRPATAMRRRRSGARRARRASATASDRCAW